MRLNTYLELLLAFLALVLATLGYLLATPVLEMLGIVVAALAAGMATERARIRARRSGRP